MVQDDLTREVLLLKSRNLLIVQGFLLILLGGVAISLPIFTTVAIEIVIAFSLFFGGVVQIMTAFTETKEGGFWRPLISGVVYVLGGLFLLFMGVSLLTLFVATLFSIAGVLDIRSALNQRHSNGWGWLLFSGVASILLAISVWIGFPLSTLWFIGILVGVNLLISGVIVLASAYKLRDLL